MKKIIEPNFILLETSTSSGIYDPHTDFKNNQNYMYDNYPAYDIEIVNETHFRIIMNVAGFDMSDLKIELYDNELRISGFCPDHKASGNRNFVYRSINQRSFYKSFRLDDFMNIKGANADNGLLCIDLECEYPIRSEKRKIPIRQKE